MVVEFDKELYIDTCSLFFKFLFNKKQWSGVTKTDYLRWINNFNQVEEGKYIAVRILNFLLYYSEDDLLKLLDDVVMSIFEENVVLPLEVENKFSLLPSDIEFAVKNAISKTIIMPAMEDLQDPGASGPEIIRHVRNHFQPQIKTIYNHELLSDTACDTVIIIDDCLGTGEQCEAFWTTAQIKNGKLLRDWILENKKRVYYIALVGYKKSVELLKKEYPELKIKCGEYLDDYHQVFSHNSRCWRDNDEQNWAKTEIEKISKENGITAGGFNDMSFAVALHKTIPDWSLPILYKNKNEWKHFIERKTTYD